MGKIIENVKFTFVRIIRLVLSYLNGGYSCAICNRRCYIYPVCKKCIEKHFLVNKDLFFYRCEKCGRNLISTEHICYKCSESTVFNSADSVYPLFSYRLWNKDLLFTWKIEGLRELSFLFAKLISKALRILNYKIIVPVPPRKKKIEQKGWDQINELCNILENKYGYIVLNLLERLSVKEQKKLNRKERLKTIKNAYNIVNESKIKKELKKVNGILPDEVCLIDDVSTTGATIECCSEILKNNGISSVNVVTLFIVD